MQTIPLQPVPNQEFQIRLDDDRYSFEIKAVGDGVVVSVTRNGVLIISGFRAVAGTPLIPYDYLEQGNFLFVTDEDQIPEWRLFNSTQSLVYFSASEIAGFKNA